jgi:hypothetical protein
MLGSRADRSLSMLWSRSPSCLHRPPVPPHVSAGAERATPPSLDLAGPSLKRAREILTSTPQLAWCNIPPRTQNTLTRASAPALVLSPFSSSTGAYLLVMGCPVKVLCPVLCPPPNLTKCDGLSRHRWKPLSGKASVPTRRNR